MGTGNGGFCSTSLGVSPRGNDGGAISIDLLVFLPRGFTCLANGDKRRLEVCPIFP